MSFIYRKATPGDIPSIMEMEALSLKHPWSESDINSLMNPPTEVAGKIAIVAQQDETPIAYIGASYVCDECEIGNVCTHPSYRRMGAAKGLFDELISICKEQSIEKIFLEVSSTNEAAIALYKSIGFVQYNIRPNYYGSGDDALLFVYNLYLIFTENCEILNTAKLIKFF